MKAVWLYKDNGQTAILFFNGWGMDEHPFAPLRSSGYDVLICYDYRKTNNTSEVVSMLKGYTSIILIAWSMGVAYAQKAFQSTSEMFSKCIAINGTLCPIDDNLGIPRQTFFATLDTLSENTVSKFYKRMCRSKINVDEFLSNMPTRPVVEQQEELQIIAENSDCLGVEESIYTDCIISKKDFIIPTENQLNFWQDIPVHQIDSFHFPFYHWKDWREIVRVVE